MPMHKDKNLRAQRGPTFVSREKIMLAKVEEIGLQKSKMRHDRFSTKQFKELVRT
jgi:hypothetical protein